MTKKIIFEFENNIIKVECYKYLYSFTKNHSDLHVNIIRKSDKAKFTIERVCGKWKIYKHEAWYITDAVLSNNPWYDIDMFDSMIHAYRFTMKNLMELM